MSLSRASCDPRDDTNRHCCAGYVAVSCLIQISSSDKDAGARQRLITPPAARRLGSVVSGDAHVCACVIRGEAGDHVQCDAPRFCGIPSKWNIERQLIVSEVDAALTSIGARANATNRSTSLAGRTSSSMQEA